MKSRTFLKRLLFGIVFAAIIVYAIYQSRNLFYGAQITVISPANNSVVRESLVIVEGNTARISRIDLDDSQIFTDPAGHFKETIALAPGVNIIKIGVEDRFKKETSRLINVYYDAPAIPTLINATSTVKTSENSGSGTTTSVKSR